MLFNSFEFIFIFLPITFVIYYYLNHIKLAKASKSFLVFSSLFFYSWWNIIYLPLILSSMLFNYIVGNAISKSFEKDSRIKISRKTLFIFGIIANLSLLGYFKYADFFIFNFNFLTGLSAEPLKLLLPLAISFFTFQQIAYLADCYLQEIKESDFLNYALFVSFFPQLIAGPIVHHKEMMPQFASKRNKIKNYKHIAMGLFIFSIGLFKKVVLADTFAVWATNGFNIATSLNLFEAWAASLAYTFQIYFDFSGYTDMAIGIALLFNIKLPINFYSPYKALDIQDFWRRWHATLGRFLRDYLYIPLGGSRKGKHRTYFNFIAIFLIAGLWHGAGWIYIFWGFLHGLALVVHKIWNELGFKMNRLLAWFVTFNFINLTNVVFRANDWDIMMKVLKAMFSLDNIVLPNSFATFSFLLSFDSISFGGFVENLQADKTIILWLILGFIITLMYKNSNQLIENFKLSKFNLFFTITILFISISMLNRVSEFLYFNF